MTLMRWRLLATSILLIAALASSLVIWPGRGGLHFEQDLLSLLPDQSRDGSEEVVRHFARRLGEGQHILLSAASPAASARAARAFTASLATSPAIAEVSGELDDAEAKKVFSTLFAHRHQLLASEDRLVLANTQDPAAAMDQARARYHDPLYGSALALAPQDPLLLFPARMAEILAGGAGGGREDGFISFHAEGRTWRLVSCRSHGSVFGPAAADLRAALLLARSAAEQAGGEALQWVEGGALAFAEQASAQARREMSLIGSLAMAAMVLLLWLITGSFSRLLLASVALASSIGLALLVTQAVLGRMHIITLVCGSTLLGICVDYLIHQLVAERPDEPRMLRCVAWGACTTAASFGILALSGFPSFRELALFAITGVAAMTLFVTGPFAALAPRPLMPRARRAAAALLPLSRWLYAHRLRLAAAALLIAAAGCPRLQFDDSLRGLNNPPPDLLAAENRFRAITAHPDQSRFLLIRGSRPQEVLERMTALGPELARLRESRLIAGSISLCHLVPSASRQEADRQLLVQRWTSPAGRRQLLAFADETGLEAAAVQAWIDELSQAQPPLQPQDLLALPAMAPLRELWHEDAEGVWALVALRGWTPAAARPLQTLADSLPGLSYIDTVDSSGRLLRLYREQATLLILGAFAVVLLALLRLFGWRRGLLAAAVPLLGVAGALGLLGLLGVNLNLFAVLGLVLAAGMGVDYAIFQAAANQDSTGQERTTLGLILCFASSELAFGMLSLSATPALRSFGLSLCFGLLLVLVLSVLARPAEDAGPPPPSD